MSTESQFIINSKTISKLLMILVCVLPFNRLEAQNLLESKKTSHFTYIFKISEKEASLVYSKKKNKVSQNLFHTIIDSFPTGEDYDKKLEPGHYLKIYSIENIQVTEIASVQNIEVFLLNNSQDLTIQIYDLHGNIVNNAEVEIKNSLIKYHNDIKAYRHQKSNKSGLLKVTHNDITTYYIVEKEYKNSAFKRGSRKVLYNTPLKYIWTPVEFVAMLPIDGVKSISRGWSQGSVRRAEDIFESIYKGVACIFDDYQCGHFRSYKRNIHHGYLVFNKPKYKPGDTIQFKTYVVDRKGKPLKKPLSVILSGNNLKIELAKLNPYDEGGYEFKFTMHDSIKPVLDAYYTVRLEDDKDNLIISKGFRYEDYELNKNNLTIKFHRNNQYKNMPFEVLIVATDDNDLILKDARIEVLLHSPKVEKFFHNYTFVPDTLGYFKQKVDPITETKIIISDSLFPKANFAYDLEVKLLTSDNEIISKTEKINYHYLSEGLEAELIKDSIYFWYKKNGLSAKRNVRIHGVDNFGNETLVFSGETPARVELNSFYSSYIAKSDNFETNHNVFQQPSLLEVTGIRTADSVKLEVINPRNLFFNYNIYLKNNLLLSGYSKELKINELLQSKENYQVSLQYVWGGKVENKEITIPLKDKLLNVQVNQPDMVYPGQKAKIALRITDFKGKPVEGVDLTAYSVTKKLNHFQPNLPYLGDEKKNRNIINSFSFNKKEFSKDLEQELDVAYWNSLARIDSIEYYKYLYPKNDIYKYAFTPNDSITQFSPFVFSYGKRVPIHVIYVDNKPVYFSWSTSQTPYSFKIRPGYHQVKLRTTKKLITIDSLYFPENKKLIFSLDTSISRDGITKQNTEPHLSESEKGHLYNYILPYKNNFKNRPAYLESNGQTQLLSVQPPYSYYRTLAGPVSGSIDFKLLDSISFSFNHEPYYEYFFDSNVLKMKPYDKLRLPNYLWSYNKNQDFNDLVINPDKIRKAYENLLVNAHAAPIYLPHPTQISGSVGRLIIEFEQESALSKKPSKIFILRPDDDDFLRVYSGKQRIFYQLEKSLYNLVFFYDDNQYFSIDSVSVLPNGSNYLKVKSPKELNNDDYGARLENIINKSYLLQKKIDYQNKNQIIFTEEVYQGLSDFNSYKLRVKGIVTGSDDSFPLPGVSVLVKGTSKGTQTDFDGQYSLLVNFGDILVFNYVGYETMEVLVRQQEINLEMPISSTLDEVVITGYATPRFSRPKTSSVVGNEINSSLYSENSITNTGQPGAVGYGTNITLRGLAEISDNKPPLLIVDGMIFTGNINQLKNDQIKSIKVLSEQEATQMFGIKGKNGAVLIELEKDALLSTLNTQDENRVFDEVFFQNTHSMNSLRQNFSDAAFWQPKLKTDQNGEASFEVTFPDDVTNWETYYLAMNGNKQTGQTKKSIKAYKLLMGQLAVPRFLVETDTTLAIGKSINYSNLEQEVNISFEINDIVQFSKKERLTNAIVDSLFVTAKDSVTLKFIIEKSDGYFDGELREIPVYSKGMLQKESHFYVLEDHKPVDLLFNPDFGEVNLFARADVLEMLDEEINHVIRYKYLCNEQIASKIKMLLMHKKITVYKNTPFKYEKEINKLIALLIKNQKSKGLWGWWEDSQVNYWISLHVIEALASAYNEGYMVDLNFSDLTSELIWRLEKTTDFEETYKILKALKLLRSKIDFIHYITKLENNKRLNFNERLKITELKQSHGMQYHLDSIYNNKRETLFGNLYFSSESEISNLLNNNIQNTLIAYKIIKSDTLEHFNDLSKMRNYFFEQRNKGHWRNTFESALIVETILNDLIQEKPTSGKPKLIINGDISAEIEEFPFKLSVKPTQKISIYKKGNVPIYFSSHQSFWNNNPMPKKGDFEIETNFEFLESNIMTGGKEVTLLVNVKVNKDAQYVMINVPIPGGCSYSNYQTRNKLESHRENYKNETAIFIENLPIGEHTFEIKLLPKYSGSYTLNPAKIELMYFPSFYANNSLNKVKIK